MAFTDESDVFGSVHEDGINLVVRHLMRQRPSLFNYATTTFAARPDLFCRPIDAAPAVLKAQNPLFTEQEPLPVFGAPFPLGIDFCVQVTDARVDFSPQDIDLPHELGELPPQSFAFRTSACAGISCPPKEVIDEFLPWVERELLAQQELAVGRVEEGRAAQRSTARLPGAGRASATFGAAERSALATKPGLALEPVRGEGRPRDTVILPTRQLQCFCLDVFAVGRFEWGSVPGSEQAWLKPRLDGLEIVDLGPQPLEDSLECYVTTVLRLGILPQLMVPTERLVLDITEVMEEQGLKLGKQVRLEPSSAPADVPHNPAVEDDMLKVFAKLTVSGGA